MGLTDYNDESSQQNQSKGSQTKTIPSVVSVAWQMEPCSTSPCLQPGHLCSCSHSAGSSSRLSITTKELVVYRAR